MDNYNRMPIMRARVSEPMERAILQHAELLGVSVSEAMRDLMRTSLVLRGMWPPKGKKVADVE